MSASNPDIWRWWPLMIPKGIDDEYYAAQEKALAAWAKRAEEKFMDELFRAMTQGPRP